MLDSAAGSTRGSKFENCARTSSAARGSYAKVHGKGVEPIRLAAAEPKADREPQENAAIDENRGSDDPRSREIDRVRTGGGQSVGNQSPADVVEEGLAKAIAKAAVAGRFDVVAQLARELEARRLARAENALSPQPACGEK